MQDIDVQDFLGWARSQPRHKEYPSGSPRACALAQYLRERGVEQPYVLWWEWWDNPHRQGEPRRIPEVMVHPLVLSSTFGALADRLGRVLEPT